MCSQTVNQCARISRYNFFTECPSHETATLIIRGTSEQFIDEIHRNLFDAISIVYRALKNPHIVPG